MNPQPARNYIQWWVILIVLSAIWIPLGFTFLIISLTIWLLPSQKSGVEVRTQDKESK